mmetsp:Transcript_67217/g.160300  ORF Transcript_67217/g.160300 Transcript_67217/m.160300 type:complete len:267 (-) Transcript_67217:177-977(-)
MDWTYRTGIPASKGAVWSNLQQHGMSIAEWVWANDHAHPVLTTLDLGIEALATARANRMPSCKCQSRRRHFQALANVCRPADGNNTISNLHPLRAAGPLGLALLVPRCQSWPNLQNFHGHFVHGPTSKRHSWCSQFSDFFKHHVRQGCHTSNALPALLHFSLRTQDADCQCNITSFFELGCHELSIPARAAATSHCQDMIARSNLLLSKRLGSVPRIQQIPTRNTSDDCWSIAVRPQAYAQLLVARSVKVNSHNWCGLYQRILLSG